jgi:hypothetical protein
MDNIIEDYGNLKKGKGGKMFLETWSDVLKKIGKLNENDLSPKKGETSTVASNQADHFKIYIHDEENFWMNRGN